MSARLLSAAGSLPVDKRLYPTFEAMLGRTALPDGYLPGLQGIILPDGRRLPIMAGGAGGILAAADVLTTADGVTLDTVWSDLQNSLAYWNTIPQEWIDTMCLRTRQNGWKTANQGSMRWERATEFGRPYRQRVKPTFAPRGLPVWDYELGMGYTRKYLLRASLSEIQSQHNEAMRSDQENLFYEVLRALFRADSYSFDDEETGTTLTVYPFYNGDGEVPPAFLGRTFAAPHTHYHASNGAFTEADILLMKEDLIEHGHDGNRILLIAANMESVIRAVVDSGGNKMFVPNWAYENPNVQLAPGDSQRTANVGPQFIGMIAGFAVRVARPIPDNYMFGFNMYGAGSALSPLAYRERNNDAEVGLLLINEDGNTNFPIINSFYMRSFGVSALNRGNATLMFYDAGAAYVDPTASFPSAT